MTLENNRALHFSNIKLCASFSHHMWIQTWVTVRKRLCGVFTSVTLTFDLWTWPFAWMLLLSLVITPDGQTDRQADGLNHSAWSQLKRSSKCRYIKLLHSSFWLLHILNKSRWSNHVIHFLVYEFFQNIHGVVKEQQFKYIVTLSKNRNA